MRVQIPLRLLGEYTLNQGFLMNESKLNELFDRILDKDSYKRIVHTMDNIWIVEIRAMINVFALREIISCPKFHGIYPGAPGITEVWFRS